VRLLTRSKHTRTALLIRCLRPASEISFGKRKQVSVCISGVENKMAPSALAFSSPSSKYTEECPGEILFKEFRRLKPGPDALGIRFSVSRVKFRIRGGKRRKPVGPRKINDPIGRRESFRSARERLNALLMAITASSWPMTCCFSSSSNFEEFLRFFLLYAIQRQPGPL
jgi:hypothetical protein